MYRISKSYSFDASHQLKGHDGKCANLHGHTYGVTVTVWAETLNDEPDSSDEGMVFDYTHMDVIIKPLIEQMDHSVLVNGDEPALAGDPLRATQFGKVYFVGKRTTAENLAHHIWDRLWSYFSWAEALEITVCETQKTSASYYESIAAGV